MKDFVSYSIKILFIFILFYTFNLSSKADSKYVGDYITCDATSAVVGSTADVTWSTNGGYISLSGTGFYRKATITKYFTGTATITCSWKYRLTASGQYTSTSKSWTLSCINNSLSIYPSTKELKVGESFTITTSHYNTNFHNYASYTLNCSDHNVVSVSSDGTVTATAKGRSEVYVYSTLCSGYCTCVVNVSENSGSGQGGQTGGGGVVPSNGKIDLTEAGTLSQYITDANKNTITSLTLSGALNGSDLRILRYMGGNDHNRSSTSGKLEYLDLRNCVFVEGGPWYLENTSYYYTSNSKYLPDYAFRWCNKIKTLYIPEYATILPSRFFTYATSNGPESVVVPASIVSVQDENFTFMYNLQSVSLPSSLQYIYTNFDGCNKLTSITCKAKEPPTAKSFSSSVYKNAILYVPKGSSSKYMKATNWLQFNDIRELSYSYNPMVIQVTTSGGTVSYGGRTRRNNYPELGYDGYMAFDVVDTNTSTITITPDANYEIKSVLIDGVESVGLVNAGKLSVKNNIPHQIKISFGVDTSPTQQCATPTMVLENGQIQFKCDTQGVEFVYQINNDVVNTGDQMLEIAPELSISVYAQKVGYKNSDVATFTYFLNPSEHPYVAGDMNGDTQVSISDVTNLVKMILEKK